jgi:hypothetical protein
VAHVRLEGIVSTPKALKVISHKGFLRALDLVIKLMFVTTSSEIIPYYHLNHSIWSLSDNKESSC